MKHFERMLKMKVKDFVELEGTGALFTVIDYDKPGCKVSPEVLTIADRNVVKKVYGDCELVEFAPKTVRNVILYVSQKN